MNRLEKYLIKELPQVDIKPFLNAFTEKKIIKKGNYLVQPGDNALFLAFVNKGCFRVFFLNEKGDEVTTWFGFQDMWVTDLLAYYKNTTASFYVEALENSEVFIIKKSNLDKLYLEHREYIDFGKRFAEFGMIMMMERSYKLQALSAEERYLEILKTPILKSKIPLKYIATYLGITDTSLSRIRKKIS